MKKPLKIAGITILVLLITVFAVYKYMMTAGGRDVSSEPALFTVSAEEIAGEFSASEEKASKKYLNKTITVNGSVTSATKSSITLNENVICNLHDSIAALPGNGTNVSLKGRLVGYDSLLEEIRLDQCDIIN